MKITKVSFARLVSTGNFSNMKIGIEAEVGEDDSSSAVLAGLELYVNLELEQRQQAHIQQEQYERLEASQTRELGDLKRDVERMRALHEKARAFLIKNGLNPDSYDDGDPFADQ